jgi:hypothetical protein
MIKDKKLVTAEEFRKEHELLLAECSGQRSYG